MMYKETEITLKDYSTISVNKLVNHLNLDSDLVDAEFLQSLIEASVDWIEERINGFIVPTTISLNVYEFSGDKIVIDHRFFNSITSFTVNDLLFTDYYIVKKEYSTEIRFKNYLSESKVSITYQSGLTPKKSFIQATIIKASDLYDTDRSDYSVGLTNNNTVLRLINLM